MGFRRIPPVPSPAVASAAWDQQQQDRRGSGSTAAVEQDHYQHLHVFFFITMLLEFLRFWKNFKKIKFNFFIDQLFFPKEENWGKITKGEIFRWRSGVGSPMNKKKQTLWGPTSVPS